MREQDEFEHRVVFRRSLAVQRTILNFVDGGC